MLLADIRDDIITMAGQFLPADDARLHPKQVEFWIETYRAQLMDELTDYGKEIDPSYFQDLGVLPLTEVDMSESNVVAWGRTVKKVVIPATVDLPENRAWWIGLVNKINTIARVYASNVEMKIKNKFACNLYFAYKIGNNVYVIGSECTTIDYEPIDYVNMRVVLAQPSEGKVKLPDGTTRCFDPDVDQYPMPQKAIRHIFELILRKELGIGMSIPRDEQNNGRDDAKTG